MPCYHSIPVTPKLISKISKRSQAKSFLLSLTSPFPATFVAGHLYHYNGTSQYLVPLESPDLIQLSFFLFLRSFKGTFQTMFGNFPYKSLYLDLYLTSFSTFAIYFSGSLEKNLWLPTPLLRKTRNFSSSIRLFAFFCLFLPFE